MSYLITAIAWIDKAFTTLIFLPMVYILYRKFRPTKPWTPRSLRLYDQGHLLSGPAIKMVKCAI